MGLLLFLLQIVLCVLFCFRIRRQERAIKRLSRNFEQGGDGRNGVRLLGRGHAWLHLVDSNFPADFASPSDFTREDAMQELDTQIASNGNYLLLPRMGVMAPLWGSFFTVEIGWAVAIELPGGWRRKLAALILAASISRFVTGVCPLLMDQSTSEPGCCWNRRMMESKLTENIDARS